MIDLAAARHFVQLHGRLLDRRRLAHLLDAAPAASVVAAVAGYANPDGGYAGLIEPDVRSLSSQPIAVLTAFDVLGGVGEVAPPAALAWLSTISNDDGGIPFHMDATDGAPQAPWMRADPTSSLHMTAAVTAAALRLGARGPWVQAATDYCHEKVRDGDRLTAYETMYALSFLDAAGDTSALAALARRLPPDGRLPVEGGADGETLKALDLAPRPDSGIRHLLDEQVIRGELDQLASAQQPDGGWNFGWQAWAPTVASEWRARLTVDAIATLQNHDRLDRPPR